MSNAEGERLLHWSEAVLPPVATTTDELRRRLYGGEPRAIIDRLILERARLEGAPGERDEAARIKVESMIADARAWQRPVFPVRGKDLVAAGWQPGPDMGRELSRLENAWIDSGFSLTRDALLAMSKAV
jgi:tRNA nucleotidyltransferase/poly(A) polymerase